jgi:hypothetical protein
MSYAACDDVGANEVATQVVVGLGATVVVVVLVVVLGAVVVVLVVAVVVVTVVVVVAWVVEVVAWVVVIAAGELVMVVDEDGEPPHALATAASAAMSAAMGRSALGPMVR